MTKVKKPELHFLIVDDDAQVRGTLSEYLKASGYSQVTEAKDGKEAIGIIQKTKIDFVISDWEMPGSTGLELLQLLRNHERYQNIPFIMITSPISQEQKKILEAATAEVDAYIVKPFRMKVLQEKIEQVIELKHQPGKTGVLVVDDDSDARKTIVEYLEKLGYRPLYEAHSGEEGFIKLKTYRSEIKFVVSDWEMPGIAGIDLLKKIREDKELASLPFIMATSQSSIERIKLSQALDADVDHYLLKPFKLEDLQTRIGHALKKAAAQKEIREELEVAEAAVLKNKWKIAEKAFHHVLLLDPKNTRAYLGLATLHAKVKPKKSFDKAIQYIRNAIAINPVSPKAYIQLAQTFEGAMSLEKAIACLKEGLEKCALSEELHYELGRVLLRRGATVEAIDEFKKALDLKPDYEDAHIMLKAARGY